MGYCLFCITLTYILYCMQHVYYEGNFCKEPIPIKEYKGIAFGYRRKLCDQQNLLLKTPRLVIESVPSLSIPSDPFLYHIQSRYT